jgi:hypothetical protein
MKSRVIAANPSDSPTISGSTSNLAANQGTGGATSNINANGAGQSSNENLYDEYRRRLELIKKVKPV